MAGRSARLWAAVLGVLVSVALVACGPVTPQRAAEARAATAGPTRPLTFQLPARPTGFDPFAPLGTADQLLAAAQFQPLVSVADGRVMPGMADWWGMIHDGHTLLLTLRHGRWSDGAPISAADLLFTIEEHLKPGSQSPLLSTLLRIQGAREFHEGRAEHVSGLVAETSRGVTIILTDASPNFMAQLTGVLVLPQHIYAGQDLRRPGIFREPKVGSGAYLFGSWQNDDEATLLPNAQFRPFPRLEHVVARVVSPDQAVPALERHDLDLALEIPPGQVSQVPAGYQTLRAPGDRVVGLSGRSLSDVRVRQAFAYAIDRESILSQQLGGQGRVVDSVLFAPDWATSPYRVRRAYDPQTARTLLAEAGWPEGRSVALVALTDDLDRGVWDAVVADLAEAGIRATIAVRPVAEREAVWRDQAVDGVIETYRMTFADPVLVGPWVRCGVPSGYCNPQLDGLLDRGESQLADADRQATYQQADALLSRELPVIPLWVPDSAVVLVNGQSGVAPLLQPATAMIDQWGPPLPQ